MSEDGVKSMIKTVNSTHEASVLKHATEKYSKAAIEWYVDDKDLDILHHAIISNNIEAVRLFFMKGFFKDPHESPSYPYMHLAAKLGRKTILQMLLQERKEDNKAMNFTYPEQYDKTTEKKTPLDVAADNGHIGCVQTILDNFYGIKARKGKAQKREAYVNLACQLDSPSALRLILSQKPPDDEIRSAVEAALKLARPECLDVLLKLRTDLSTLFEGMNLYHVLFTYSLSLNSKWYESLLAVTSVLIKHKHDIMQCIPFRTYPLYSLLAHPTCHDLEVSASYLLACMLVVLNAGADPNFDEVILETELAKANMKTAFGRPSYSSSLHCLFDTIGRYADQLDQTKSEQKLTLRKHMMQCTEALLKHGADLGYVGLVENDQNTSGNGLHCFCRVAPKIGINERYLRTLLRHGANPDAKVFGYYPLNMFYEQLLAFAVDSEYSHVVDVEHSTVIMDSMSPHALRDSSDIFNNMVSETLKEHTNAKIEKIVSLIRAEYEKRVSSFWSLKKLSVLTIWLSCDRRIANVLKLEIPKRLRDCISETFD